MCTGKQIYASTYVSSVKNLIKVNKVYIYVYYYSTNITDIS